MNAADRPPTAEELTAALGGKKSPAGWRAPCPAHKDAVPSLDITEGTKGVVFCCRAGCSQQAVLQALQERGIWPSAAAQAPRPARPAPPRQTGPATAPARQGSAPSLTLSIPALGGAPTHRYEYHSPGGALIGVVCRWERPGAGKEIRPALPVAGGWRWVGFPEPRPLYGLDLLAAAPAMPVLLVEGEKTADAARALAPSHIVTTWPGGTGAVDRVDLSPLKGRDVVLWPDHDAPGIAAMKTMAERLLKAGAKSVRVVKLPPDLPEKWDLADQLPAGVDPLNLIASAQDPAADRLATLGLVSADALVAKEFVEPRWAVPDLLPEGLTILAGRPKSGKSWLALGIAVAVASGSFAVGTRCPEGDVLAVMMEDPERRLKSRILAVLQGAPAPARLTLANKWNRADQGGLDDLRAWLRTKPDARLVLVDTLALFRGKASKDEGVYANDYSSIAALKAVADEAGVAVVVIHHLRKDAAGDPLESVSGTSGLTGAADTIAVLKREPADRVGMLYVRGRDVHEQEIALQFDDDTCTWSKIGSAAEFRMSEERRAVIRALRDVRDGMSPAEIADAIGKRRGNVRMLIRKMLNSGAVVKLASGKYAVQP